MTGPETDLMDGFAGIAYAEWRAGVEQMLDGRDFSRALRHEDADGLVSGPLHAPGDDISPAPELCAAFTRAFRASLPGQDAIEIRQAHDHPDPATANDLMLTDLARGATGLAVHIDPDARHGVAIGGLEDLARALDGIDQTLAPLHIAAGRFGPAVAALLMAHWEREGVSTPLGGFGIDPLGALLREGRLLSSLPDTLHEAAEVAAQCAGRWPGIRAIAVSGADFHETGATPAEELGLTLSVGVAYLRAMARAGIDINVASQQIEFTLAVDTGLFPGIAKLRAMRVLWSRIVTASGGRTPHIALAARSSARMMSRKAAHTNMLRTTAAAMAARIGGADAIMVAPYLADIDNYDRMARRIARNQPILIDEESHIGRVRDPAGGSFAIEAMSIALARKAWDIFRSIESEGGIVSAIESGAIHRRLAASADRLMAGTGEKHRRLVGVSVYCDPDDHVPGHVPATSAIDRASLRARTGGTIAGLEPAPDAAQSPPIPRIRLAAPFEELDT